LRFFVFFFFVVFDAFTTFIFPVLRRGGAPMDPAMKAGGSLAGKVSSTSSSILFMRRFGLAAGFGLTMQSPFRPRAYATGGCG
jgi:hypothetical protein